MIEILVVSEQNCTFYASVGQFNSLCGMWIIYFIRI